MGRTMSTHKLNAAHYFKAGARLARTSDYTRAQAIAWFKGNARNAAIMLRGFDAERGFMKTGGGCIGRAGRPLGKA